MKNRKPVGTRLCLEELEGRLVLSPVVTTSTNWSGYAVTAAVGTVTAVSGSWVVPKVTGTGTAYAASWVGIDGYSSPSVEQIGTDSDISNGKPSYYAWFEMYPSGVVYLSNLTINPGDTISASVSYQSGTFTLQLTDGKQTETVTQTAPGVQRASAEWIEEAPSSGFGVLPLANFGSVSFSSAQATIGGKTGPINYAFGTGTQVEQINMVSQFGASEDSTSALNVNGNGFTVTFSAASKPAPQPPPPPPHWGWWWWQNNMPGSQQNGMTSGTQAVAQNVPVLFVSNPGVMTLSSPPSPIVPFSAAYPGQFSTGVVLAQQMPGIPNTGRADQPAAVQMPNDAGTPSERLSPDTVPERIPAPNVDPGEAPVGLREIPGLGNWATDAYFIEGNSTQTAAENVNPSDSQANHGEGILVPAAGAVLTLAQGVTLDLATRKARKSKRRFGLEVE